MSKRPSNSENKELHAFIIAILVIGSFVVFFGYSLVEKPTMDTAKEVVSLFGGYVAAVLVYFFGQKQAQTLTNQAVEATTERDKFKKAHETDTSSINESTETMRQLKDQIETLKKLYGL